MLLHKTKLTLGPYGILLNAVQSNWKRIPNTNVQRIPTSLAMSNREVSIDSVRDRSDIWNAICERYSVAQASNATKMTETAPECITENISEDEAVRFVLRIATTLRDKPKANQSVNSASIHSNGSLLNAPSGGQKTEARRKSWINPFLPPDPELFVCHLSPTHSLVLNKFNIVAHHSIVITREFVPQEEPMSDEDMNATWSVLRCMPGSGGLAYFNCGPSSGASQPHKHVQVIPLPLFPDDISGSQNVAEDLPFQKIIDKSLANIEAWKETTIQCLPFSNFVIKIDHREADGRRLALMHDVLVRLAALSAGLDPYNDENFSYNTIFTKDFMMVVPRRMESIGPLSCNAMAFAGSFFVRSKEELDFIHEQGPFKILKEVGFWKQG